MGAIEMGGALGLSITVADLLQRAGRSADEATRRFLQPRLAHLSSPDAMADRREAAERIARAVRAREKVCVFGDYDCDGITSTAIVTSVIRALGGDAVPLLATRLDGGYGFSEPALRRVRTSGATLLVTCDCGSSDHERLAAARASGIDPVVIDHHLVPAQALPALAFLNPHRPDCGFPYKGLASCGLALVLAAEIRKLIGRPLDLRPLLDLVAIGTIADVAPLTGDNRALVRAGLTVLATGARPGLRALADHARLNLQRGVTGEDVAFRIAPRINAPGRLGDPDLALALLMESDAATAAAMAASIEQITIRRRAVQEGMIAEALAEIERCGYASAPAIVLARQGWHPGVVGIVAGRIASRYHKPTVVCALEGSTGRGSVRGPPGFRLHDALTACRAELEAFGGHQAAAGVELRANRIEAFRDAWCAACHVPGGATGPVVAQADARLDDRDDPTVVVADLEKLEPCGEANRAPRLLFRGAVVRAAREIKGHLKLDLAVGRRAMGGFGFELGSLVPHLTTGRIDILGSLRRDTWRGGDAVEIRVERVSRG